MKSKDLQEGIEEIRKLYGTASVFTATDNFRSNVQSISTGSFNLNDAIGVGGVPAGRLILLSGPESTGKSLLALSVIKEAQKDGGLGYYMDAEFTYDPDWTSRLGVDKERMLVSQTNNAQEVFELLLGKPKNEKRKEAIPGILTNEKILRAGLKVVVIDSIDALSTPMEMSSEVGKSNMALMARFLPPELRRLTPILAKTGVTVVAILQARSNPGQTYGDSTTVSGGRAMKHAASLWMDLGVVFNSQITIDGTKDGEKIGQRIKVKIKKNKVAPPFKETEFTVLFQKGVDVRPEIAEQAVDSGVITKESERISTYKSETFGDFRWNGLSKLVEELAKPENKGLLAEIALKVKEAKKKQNEDRLTNSSFKEVELDISDDEEAVSEGTEENGEPQENIEVEVGNSEEKDTPVQKTGDSSTSGSNDSEELENKTLNELKEMAKKLNVPNLYKFTTKDNLIRAIIGNKP